MEFTERLKELRKSKGLSQSELAKYLGVAKSTISMLEVGSRKPSWELAEEIADYFNVDLDFLLGREEQSRFFMDYELYNVASELSADSELFAVVEKASKDNNYKQRLLAIAKLMENSND